MIKFIKAEYRKDIDRYAFYFEGYDLTLRVLYLVGENPDGIGVQVTCSPDYSNHYASYFQIAFDLFKNPYIECNGGYLLSSIIEINEVIKLLQKYNDFMNEYCERKAELLDVKRYMEYDIEEIG